MKRLSGIFVAALAVIVLTGASSCSEEKSSGGSAAKIHLIASKSYCTANPFDARITVFMAFRNTGSEAAKVSALPHRRYSDGTTNASALDEVETTVPAFTTKRAYAEFDYNAQTHDLIECSIEVNPPSTPIPVAVHD